MAALSNRRVFEFSMGLVAEYLEAKGEGELAEQVRTRAGMAFSWLKDFSLT